MTTVLPFSNNSITVYKYEPFSYTISNSNYPPTEPTVTVSTGIPPSLVVNNNSNVVFSSVGGYNGSTSSNELIVVTVGTASSSNTVSINSGRFRDSNSNSFSNTAFTFYKNEPIPSATLTASISLLSPLLTFPALPSGLTLTKTASNQFTLSGTPLIQTPTSNYQIIGQGSNSDTGKIVTSVNSITINGERLRLSVEGTPTVSNMIVGTAITQRIVTASFPLASGSNLRYTWDALPAGLYFGDSGGISQASGFQPVDASYTLTLQGTPTVGAAKSFAAAGITTYTVNVQALRLTTPTLSNSTFFTFQFSPTVLFDDVTIPTYYTDIALNPTQTFFFAKTYFGTDASISTIFSPDLRTDLSLSFISNQARAYLTGTPTSAGSNTYTIRASNSLGVSRDLPATISVSNTSLTFDMATTPAVDTCYNYILSRPSSNAKTGYYPGSVQFKVIPVPSTLPLTITTSDLAGTGLSLSSVVGNAAQLTGTPDTITALKTVTVTAANTITSASATTTVKVAVVNDLITFASVSSNLFDFAQNRQITPIQIEATAVLSDRPITSYSATGLPDGVSISSGGLITGTPLSDTAGTAVITATTGFTSGSNSYAFTMKPDSILFRVGSDPNARSYSAASNSFVYQAGDPVAIPIQGQTYSGQAITRYDVSSTSTFGLTISSTGLLSGPWMTGIPPSSALYPTLCNFFINATGGLFTGSLPTRLRVAPTVVKASILNVFYTPGNSNPPTYWSYDPSSSSLQAIPLGPTLANPSSNATVGFVGGGLRFKTTTTVPNLVMGSVGRAVLAIGTRLSTVSNFQYIDLGGNGIRKIGDVEHNPGTSTWWIGGDPGEAGTSAVLLKSTNDGQTWGEPLQIQTPTNEYVQTRNYGVSLIGSPLPPTPFTEGGLALCYTAGVLMAGGTGNSSTMLRSTNDGATWALVEGGFRSTGECATIRATSSVWVATGSSLYQSCDGNSNTYTGAADTILYSTDQGSNWAAAAGGFTMFGYDLVYGSNAWLATGVSVENVDGNNLYTPQLRYSTDGSTWGLVDLSTNDLGLTETNTNVLAPLRISTPVFEGTHWTVFVVSPSPLVVYRFQHNTTSSLESGWSQTTMTVPDVASELRLTSITPPGYLYTGTPPITLDLTFTTAAGGGPTVTSTSTSFRLNQYLSIEPIVLTATGTGVIYFFILESNLPQGLTFNPTTNTITGVPVKLGRVVTPVYVRDDNGITTSELIFETILPAVQKVQTSAAAFTSLLRQYTIVNAAQNARDNTAFPAGDRLLGEFTAPYPPNVVTQTVDPNCFGACK